MFRQSSFILLLFFNVSLMAYEPNTGDIAPDFKITAINGETFNLKDYIGTKSVYVVYWNTWCHFCMKKLPKLNDIEKNYSDEIKIIAINTSRSDSIQELLDFQKRFGLNYMLAFDENEIITDLYNVRGVPTEFIIDINGIIQYRDDVPKDIKTHISKWNTLN